MYPEWYPEGSTVEIVGLSHLGKDKEGGKMADFVSKEKLLNDIQFRGAISDFYVSKAKIMDADYDPLFIKINEDDIYGDGNNFELVLLKEASEVWTYIEEETIRRRKLLEDEKLRAIIEKVRQRSIVSSFTGPLDPSAQGPSTSFLPPPNPSLILPSAYSPSPAARRSASSSHGSAEVLRSRSRRQLCFPRARGSRCRWSSKGAGGSSTSHSASRTRMRMSSGTAARWSAGVRKMREGLQNSTS